MNSQDVSASKRLHEEYKRKPHWLKVNLPSGSMVKHVGSIQKARTLYTVCEEALCPNRHECWNSGTATFMLMGDTCTRACRFCSVKAGKPNGWLDLDEPQKLAEAIKTLNLKYVVLTSVTRDDLPDGGAKHLASCINAIKEFDSDIIIEILIPDFQGKLSALKQILATPVEVVAHNIETVERLTPKVRDPRANYKQSLAVLKNIKKYAPSKFSKSSIMVGVGESWSDLHQTFQDLREVETDFLTIGQYLRPSRKHMPVEKYIHPDIFEQMRLEALKYGFKYVASGPLVRSSYKAGEFFIESIVRQNKALKSEKSIFQPIY